MSYTPQSLNLMEYWLKKLWIPITIKSMIDHRMIDHQLMFDWFTHHDHHQWCIINVLYCINVYCIVCHCDSVTVSLSVSVTGLRMPSPSVMISHSVAMGNDNVMCSVNLCHVWLITVSVKTRITVHGEPNSTRPHFPFQWEGPVKSTQRTNPQSRIG